MRSVLRLVVVSLLGWSAACAPDGSSAYVSRNVPLNSSCDPVEEGVGIATGVWDVGADRSPASCLHSYEMSLFINSNLKANAREATGRAEPNVLLITHADITLMDSSESVLSFQDGTPNPYRVQTAASLDPTSSDQPQQGLVQIEAIPRVYAKKFGSEYDGKNILVEVQLAGTTTGDVDVEFRPFLYPLVICKGCMSYCKTRDLMSDPNRINALTADRCTDNAGQDDRACIDSGC